MGTQRGDERRHGLRVGPQGGITGLGSGEEQTRIGAAVGQRRRHQGRNLGGPGLTERQVGVAVPFVVLDELDRLKLRGVHLEETDEISIEGDSSDVILDGETFRAEIGQPIVLRPAQPLSFVRLAA